MIQLKATCLRCRATGYDTNASGYSSLLCPDCEGKGILVLTSQKWDISLEQVPLFSLAEMEEMRKKR